MSCNCPEPMDCCAQCPEPPAPVLPRCNIALPDGVFTNTTITVEGGCITAVATGRPPQYSPSTCCEGGGGGGDDGAPGPRGPAGRDGNNATITIGQVNTVGSNQPARVVNTGTQTNAVLNFYIPAGEEGQTGASSHGISDSSAGIVFEDGTLTGLPAAWPPALAFVATAMPTDVAMTISQPSNTNGVVTVTLDLTQFRNNIHNWTTNKIAEAVDPLEARILDLETKLAALTARVNQYHPLP